MIRTATEILRSLVADIEAMQNPRDVYAMGFNDGETNDHQPQDFFGPFQCYMENSPEDMPNDSPSMVDGGAVSVEWPNLRILLEEAKEALK